MSLFSKQMNLELARLVEENKKNLFPEKGTAKSHQISQTAWAELRDNMNAQFRTELSVEQLKEKVKGLKKTVRESLGKEKTYKKVTGGGPEAKKEDPTKEEIKDLISKAFGGGASFEGVPGGVSTSLFGETSSSMKRKANEEAGEEGNVQKMAKENLENDEEENDEEVTQILSKGQQQPQQQYTVSSPATVSQSGGSRASPATSMGRGSPQLQSLAKMRMQPHLPPVPGRKRPLSLEELQREVLERQCDQIALDMRKSQIQIEAAQKVSAFVDRATPVLEQMSEVLNKVSIAQQQPEEGNIATAAAAGSSSMDPEFFVDPLTGQTIQNLK